MSSTLEPVANLAHQFSRLPGIGSKTALRLAYFVLSMDETSAGALADAIVAVKKEVHICPRCGNYTVEDFCGICSDARRTSEVICVVCDPRDVLSLEKMKDFSGRYHVLHGQISPIDGIGPDDLRIKELVARIGTERVQEVILATNPDVEGEATASYIAQLIKPLGVKVTRIAHGVPIGGNLEYIDELTLQQAVAGRHEL